jgi:hypothetical protein
VQHYMVHAWYLLPWRVNGVGNKQHQSIIFTTRPSCSKE